MHIISHIPILILNFARVWQIDKMSFQFLRLFSNMVTKRTLGHFLFWLKNVFSKLLELYLVGTLNLCLKTNLAQCKRNELNLITQPRENIQNMVKMCRFGSMAIYPNILALLDVFSIQGDQNEPIPFALCQASWDKSVEYPQHIIPRTLKFHFFGGGGGLTPHPWGGSKNICQSKKKSLFSVYWSLE